MPSSDVQTLITAVEPLAGVGLGAWLTWWLSGRRERSHAQDAARAAAVEQLAVVADGMAALRSEVDVYRERSAGLRARLRQAVTAVLDAAAGVAEGNPARGAGAGLRRMMDWDAAEGARYQERVRAVMAGVNFALVRLNALPDPGIRRAAAEVVSRLGKIEPGLRIRDAGGAWAQVEESVTELARAVHTWGGGPPIVPRRRLRAGVRSRSLQSADDGRLQRDGTDEAEPEPSARPPLLPRG